MLPQNVAHKNQIAPIPLIVNGTVYESPMSRLRHKEKRTATL